jgi:farnesyl-diphosphate farnesyltransferase
VAEAYQDYILPLVSRTFALTIPQLPSPLRSVVANAYLLCRIADTIEDEPSLTPADKERFQETFSAVVAGQVGSDVLSGELHPLLSTHTSAAERELVRNMALILRLTSGFSAAERAAMERCVAIMCRGMHRFSRNAGPAGLKDLPELDRYCYYVAGVVGEMLTDLFCAHSAETARQRDALYRLSPSFGQGLQMTNILKDVWEDRERGVCWYPRDLFLRHGVELGELSPGHPQPGFAAGLTELVGVAHAHLRAAMHYTLLIPPQEAGVRRFCSWNIGLAVMTLRKLMRNTDFTCGEQVKISRKTVAWTVLLTRVGVRSNGWLMRLFDWAAKDLPLGELPAPAASPEAEPARAVSATAP